MRCLTTILCAAAAFTVSMAPITAAGQAVERGTVYRAPSGVTLRLILDSTTVGPVVSMGELTFPPNIDSGDHAHGSTEILYVLEGELEHTVDGKTTILKPGMAGYVRPPGKIRHKTGAAGAKVLVVWTPGDEAARIAARWTREP
jgi:quercetin dioxygenase-like cupin family protein